MHRCGPRSGLGLPQVRCSSASPGAPPPCCDLRRRSLVSQTHAVFSVSDQRSWSQMSRVALLSRLVLAWCNPGPGTARVCAIKLDSTQLMAAPPPRAALHNNHIGCRRTPDPNFFRGKVSWRMFSEPHTSFKYKTLQLKQQRSKYLSCLYSMISVSWSYF